MLKYSWVILMKKVIYLIIFLLLFFAAYYNREEIFVFYNDFFTKNQRMATELENNEYALDYDFKYVHNTNDFSPDNKQDIINIYYTVINSGMSEFTFYCPETFETCADNVRDVANSQLIISTINNFVHPFNGFKDIETEIDSTGKITVRIKRIYTDEMIIILNYKIDEILKNNITDNMNDKDKIKAIHDHIINNAKYDQDRSDKNILKYKSDTAYGPLIEGYGLCGGYTDAMMLFLEKMQIKNYKISNDNHIWNYIYVDGNWYHLDLTWDDPIVSDGSDALEYTFFLITNKELQSLNTNEHSYDISIYN